MKRIIVFSLLLSLAGMTIFAQDTDMSYYTEAFNRMDATFVRRLEVLEAVRDENLSGIGEFYHNALKVFLTRIPDIRTRPETEAAEASAKIICQGLGDEAYIEAAPDLWLLAQSYDVARDVNDGLVMQEALVAIGRVGDKNYVPHIALRLDDFNTAQSSDVETRRRVQRAVVGTISALEALHEIAGYRPVFFATIGWYDPTIRAIASAALPNIVEDPGEVISGIIQNNYNDPSVRIAAWQEMLRSRAPDSSKAKVAAVALAAGWAYPTNDPHFQRLLREMRMSAIDVIRELGVEDDSVYANLERSYNNNFISNAPYYDEIRKAVDTLAVIKTEEAAEILLKFLRELHTRRRSGPWGNKERQALQLVIPGLGATGTHSVEARGLLTTITFSNDYTGAEQGWARDALRRLGQ